MSKCCIIKSNTPELRQRLEQSGISVCICSSFKEADWCVDNGYAKTYNGGVRSHISNAAKHKTKTAYGYRWVYAQ